MNDEKLWYKNAVFYQLHVKCFRDSNRDGIGDFKGLTSKLDYIKDLGCTALWLQPFYPSPLRDDGYDIGDYYNVNPMYGTLADFKGFLKEAHKRDLKVVTELVINHTSDQHAWFQKSRRAKPGTAWRDFYVWSDTADMYKDARIIFKDFETSNWSWDPVAKAYYWHRFYSHQPDLNYDNPKVHQEILRVLDFWMKMGVDGLRLDAIPYLYEREGTDCENLPETHAFLKKLRAHLDRKWSNRMLLAEANQWPDQASSYFGNEDECHMAFHFPVMPRLFMSLRMEDRFPIVDIMEQTPKPPPSCQWATFLRNHDELTLEMVTDEERDYMYRAYAKDPHARINLGIRRRLAPLLENDRSKIELMIILLFSLPGSPIIYYGDEIGMGDNYYLGDRHGVRTPMQWNEGKNAGFSDANPQKLYLPLIIDSEYHHAYLNVENQERMVNSLLWWTRRTISVRQQYKAFGFGDLTFLMPDNAKVLAFIREHEEESVLVIINLSRYAQCVELNLQEFAGRSPKDLFSQNRFSRVRDTPYGITLGPYGYYWLLLEKQEEHYSLNEDSLAEISLKGGIESLVNGDRENPFFKRGLPRYLMKSRWFRSKTKKIRKVAVRDGVKFDKAFLAVVQAVFSDGTEEDYLLPLTIARGDQAHHFLENHPRSVIAKVVSVPEEAYLIDAIYDETFRSDLLKEILRRRKLKGKKGCLHTTLSKKMKKNEFKDALLIPSKVIALEQTNSSIIYNESIFLKLYRKLDEGVNPETELVRYLSERAKFSHVPAYYGSLEWENGTPDSSSAALVQEYIPNGGNAWDYTLDAVKRYYEQLLSTDVSEKSLFDQSEEVLEPGKAPQPFYDAIGWMFLESIALLGQRTAEMHLAMNRSDAPSGIASELFTPFYQKSLYQAFRGQLKRVFLLLKQQAGGLSEENQETAFALLAREKELIGRFQKLLERKFDTVKIRVHGDYHLGQVLHTGKDWTIIDFEGEPALPVSERKLKRSALQDVAGMIRSFHYAAVTAQEQFIRTRGDHASRLELFSEYWYSYVTRVLIQAYLAALGGEVDLVPQKKEDFSILLDCYLLNKGIYELGYELQNRPDWIKIPLKGMERLLGDKK